MIEGAKVMMGGEEWTIPALSFKQVRTLTPQLQILNSGNVPVWDPEYMTATVDVVHAAISRNYPDATREQVEELLDLSNAPKIFPVIMGLSGFIQTSMGE